MLTVATSRVWCDEQLAPGTRPDGDAAAAIVEPVDDEQRAGAAAACRRGWRAPRRPSGPPMTPANGAEDARLLARRRHTGRGRRLEQAAIAGRAAHDRHQLPGEARRRRRAPAGCPASTQASLIRNLAANESVPSTTTSQPRTTASTLSASTRARSVSTLDRTESARRHARRARSAPWVAPRPRCDAGSGDSGSTARRRRRRRCRPCRTRGAEREQRRAAEPAGADHEHACALGGAHAKYSSSEK